MKITVEFESLAEFTAFGNLGGTVKPKPAPKPAPVPAPVPAPAPTPVPAPAVVVSQARMLNMPARSLPGTLRWTVKGVTYMASVVTNGDIIIAGLYSAPGTTDGVQMARLEQMIDSGMDTKPPGETDEQLRQWIATRVLPPLNAWFAAHPGVTDGAIVSPVSADPIPAAWSMYDRAAAALAQWVRLTPSGFTQ